MYWLKHLSWASSLATFAHARNVPTQPQEQVACTYRSIIALGDSYAAGLQSINTTLLPLDNKSWGNYKPHTTNSTCLRNRAAYSFQFAQKHGLDTSYGFYACTGADTRNITFQYDSSSVRAAPDLITINMGGNNGDAFASVVAACVYEHWIPGWTGDCAAALSNAQRIIQTIGPKFDTLLDAMKRKFPNAKVATLGYAQFYAGPESYSWWDCQEWIAPTSTTLKDTLNRLVVSMNYQLQLAASKAKATYVDVDRYFEGHRFCETSWATPYFHYEPIGVEWNWDPFVFYKGLFHPTTQGQTVMLKALSDHIGCSMDVDQDSVSKLQMQVDL